MHQPVAVCVYPTKPAVWSLRRPLGRAAPSYPAPAASAGGMVLHLGGLAANSGATDYMEAIALSDGSFQRVPCSCAPPPLYDHRQRWLHRSRGAMAQLSAMVASALGQLSNVPTPRMRLLVACGVAAGIASAYKVPSPAPCLWRRSVLGSIAMENLAPVFSAVIATLTGQGVQFSTHRPSTAPPRTLAPLGIHSVHRARSARRRRRPVVSAPFALQRNPLCPVPAPSTCDLLSVASWWTPFPCGDRKCGNGFSVVTTLSRDSWGMAGPVHHLCV